MAAITHVTAGSDAVTASKTNAIIDGINAVNGRAIITASGTWQVPVGVSQFKVTLCGGAGRGGSSYMGGYENNTLLPALPGGDSPMCSKIISGIDAGTSINVIIGVGGSGSPGTGGTTSFGPYLQSTGGVASAGSNQGAQGTHTGEIRHMNELFMNSSGVGYGKGVAVFNNQTGTPGICVIEW